MKTSSRFWLAPLLVLLFAHTASAFYDTHIGRWLNRDPLGEDGGRQLYQFCLNSPVNFVDFHGLKVVVNVDGKTGPTDVGGDWTKVSQMITTICDKAKLNNDGTITMEGGFAGSQTQSGCCCLDQLVKSNNKWLVNLSRDEGAPRTEVPRDKGMNRPVPPGYAGPPAPG